MGVAHKNGVANIAPAEGSYVLYAAGMHTNSYRFTELSIGMVDTFKWERFGKLGWGCTWATKETGVLLEMDKKMGQVVGPTN